MFFKEEYVPRGEYFFSFRVVPLRIEIVLNDPQNKTPCKIDAQIWHVPYCKT